MLKIFLQAVLTPLPSTPTPCPMVEVRWQVSVPLTPAYRSVYKTQTVWPLTTALLQRDVSSTLLGSWLGSPVQLE